MPVCSKCHPINDLGRICPHEGPGREVWEQGRAAGRAEVAVVLHDLIDAVQTAIDDYETQMHGSARAYLIGVRIGTEVRLRELDTAKEKGNERIN